MYQKFYLCFVLIVVTIAGNGMAKFLLVDVPEERGITDKAADKKEAEIGTDSSRFVPENNFDPMNTDEIRLFKIDKESKKDCKLPENEITVRKSVDLNLRTFEVVRYEQDAFIKCSSGYVDKLSAVGVTNNCGIGKILTKLCLMEENIHEVENNKENQAVSEIRSWVEECKSQESCKEEDHQEELVELEKWVNAECSKLVGLFMNSDTRGGGYVYFNSAIDTGFSQMFIKIVHYDMYPKDSCRSVEVLKERYNADGDMVDGDDVVYVNRQFWFFCKPKTKTTQPECEKKKF